MIRTTIPRSRLLQKSLLTISVVAVFILGASSLIMPTRSWNSALISAYMVLTVSLGALVFIALGYITGAGWSVAFRRVPEALALTLPVAGVVLIAIVALGAGDYEWRVPDGDDPGTYWFKERWLASDFLLARAVVYVVLWSLLAWAMVTVSRRQDHTNDVRQTLVNRKLSAIVLIIFAPTFSLAACDWFMALEPMWFSTVWGAYHFAGLAMSTLAVTILFCLFLRRYGPLAGMFGDDHLHDLGKLLLGFSCFWMYLWFSQYMLIWYSNIPEETSYFIARTQGVWGPLMIASLALNWVIPFFALLRRSVKRSPVAMGRIAILVLCGRWLDLYLMVFPSTSLEGPAWEIHESVWSVIARIPEVAAFSLAICMLCLLFFRGLAKAPIVPIGDPFLSESLPRQSHMGGH